MEFAEAEAVVTAHATKLEETVETAERPGDAFEQSIELADMEKAAVATTKPRVRKPVVVETADPHPERKARP